MRELYKTDIELIMKEQLEKEGINFVEQFPIRCKYGYILDICIPELKIDIECDGSFWHPLNNKHDRNRNGFLKENGWEVLRFRDNQIKSNTNICIKVIKDTIERRLKEYENKSKG